MPDKFDGYEVSIDSPACEVFQITPDDGSDLALATRAINVAQSGNVRLESVAGTVATVYIAAGIAFPIRAKRVFVTGTDATGLVGML
jgi:hypothetical protein